MPTGTPLHTKCPNCDRKVEVSTPDCGAVARFDGRLQLRAITEIDLADLHVDQIEALMRGRAEIRKRRTQ